jgi:plasmid stabilization system protein ParE
LNIRFTAEANADFIDCVAWYEGRQTNLGAEFIQHLDAVLQRVRKSPRQFPRVSQEIRKASLERFPYSMYFRIAAGEVQVIAVLHQHRDPRTWQRRI